MQTHRRLAYLIIVIFFTLTQFLELKFYTQMRWMLNYILGVKLHNECTLVVCKNTLCIKSLDNYLLYNINDTFVKITHIVH